MNPNNIEISKESQSYIDDKKVLIEKEKKSLLFAVIGLSVILLALKFVFHKDINNLYVILAASLIVVTTFLKIYIHKNTIKKIYQSEEKKQTEEKMIDRDHEYYPEYLKNKYMDTDPDLYNDLLGIYNQTYPANDLKRNRQLLEEGFKICRELLETEHYRIVYYLQGFNKSLLYVISDVDGVLHKTLHKKLFMIEYDYCLKLKDKNLMEMTLVELKKTHNWDEDIQNLNPKL